MTEQKTIQQKFVAAWDEIENPELDGENPHFKKKYATLKATLRVIREACKKHKLAYMQTLSPEGEGWMLHSLVVSDDGESFPLSSFPLEVPPNPQSFGSNLTYAKRQQAQADWGITGDPDDDGEAGAEAARKASNRQPNTRTPQNRNGGNKGRQNPARPQKTEEERKAEYIARINARTVEAGRLGIKPEGIASFVAAKFEGRGLEELALDELTVVGTHINGLIKDKEALNG